MGNNHYNQENEHIISKSCLVPLLILLSCHFILLMVVVCQAGAEIQIQSLILLVNLSLHFRFHPDFEYEITFLPSPVHSFQIFPQGRSANAQLPSVFDGLRISPFGFMQQRFFSKNRALGSKQFSLCTLNISFLCLLASFVAIRESAVNLLPLCS